MVFEISNHSRILSLPFAFLFLQIHQAKIRDDVLHQNLTSGRRPPFPCPADGTRKGEETVSGMYSVDHTHIGIYFPTKAMHAAIFHILQWQFSPAARASPDLPAVATRSGAMAPGKVLDSLRGRWGGETSYSVGAPNCWAQPIDRRIRYTGLARTGVCDLLGGFPPCFRRRRDLARASRAGTKVSVGSAAWKEIGKGRWKFTWLP